MRRLIQRYIDWRRERLIAALRRDITQLFERGETAAAREACLCLFEECEQRSPAQIERMERAQFDAMDPHAQAVFTRTQRIAERAE